MELNQTFSTIEFAILDNPKNHVQSIKYFLYSEVRIPEFKLLILYNSVRFLVHESFLDRSLFDHRTGYLTSLDLEFLVQESILDRTLFDHKTGYFTPFGPDTFRQKRPDAFVLLVQTLFDFKTGHFSYMDRILSPGTGHFSTFRPDTF